MLRLTLTCLLNLFLLCSFARADLIFTVDNVDTPRESTLIRVAVRSSGPDRLNNLALAFGLGDGGPVVGGDETATIVGYSLDQTIWDSDGRIGETDTSAALGLVSLEPALPSGATVLNLPGAGLTSSVDANGVLAYFDLNLATRIDKITPLRLDPNILGFTAAQGPSQTNVNFTSNAGTLRFTAVPEPSALFSTSLLGALTLLSRKRRR